jgi:hypothetical protein
VECEDLNDVAWDGCTEGEIGEFVVNSHSGNWQVNAAVAPYPDGRFAVVWESKLQDGSKLGVYGQQLAASGKAFGFEFQANTFTPDDQGAPSAAALSSGNLVVVWESWGQDGPGYGIYGQLFNPDGSKAGKELLLNEYTKQDQRYPAVAATADGFVLAWSGIGEEDAGGVYVRRFDKDGAALGSQSLVNVTTDWDQRNPSLAGLADGTVAVVWESQNQDGSDGIGVFSRLFAADLTPAGSEFQVNVFSPGHQLAPRVSAFPAGGFVVVWQSEEQDGNGQGVFGRVYDASGLAVGTEFLLSANTLMDQEAPSVAALSDGDFVAAWQSKGDDGSDYTVMAARFKGNGDKEGKDWQVNVFADSNQSFPAVAALSSLGFVIVWQSWAQDGDGFAIVAQRYDLSGNKLYH